MTTIGYARVSTEDQNLDLQRDALTAAGCAVIYEDLGCSAIARNRPGFDAALAALARGDTFIIWKMDRAFRSLLQALTVLEQFERDEVSFLSLTEQIDTSTPMGRCMYQIRNAFAELERSLISERTRAGMAAARRRGKVLGRPPKINDSAVARAREALATNPASTLATLAQKLGVSPRTLARALKKSAPLANEEAAGEPARAISSRAAEGLSEDQ